MAALDTKRRIPAWAWLAAGVVVAAAFIAGCRVPPAVENTADPSLRAFRERATGNGIQNASVEETAALERFKNFLSHLNEAYVRENTRSVYAENAWFNDTLKTLRGSGEIEAYLLETARTARAIRVEFLDTVRSGDGSYYLRWRMETEVAKIAGGRPVATLGITHVKLDLGGRVAYHQDYWDSTSGVFDHVPVIGRGTRFVKSRL